MSADDLWFLSGLLLVLAFGFASWRFRAARRRAGDIVMSLFDRGGALAEGVTGLRRIHQDDLGTMRALFHRHQDRAVERWRLAVWLGIALFVVFLISGHDLAVRIVGRLG
jgi:hypothetical protein